MGEVRDGYWTSPKENMLIYYNEISETMERLLDSLGRKFYSQPNTTVLNKYIQPHLSHG